MYICTYMILYVLLLHNDKINVEFLLASYNTGCSSVICHLYILYIYIYIFIYIPK